ncbi:MAG TPA: universal stress protein [Burkholderiaceae bacterium]
MYKHILIPTDGSKLSGRAIEQAMAIARSMEARVTGLFVAPAATPLLFKGLVPVRHLQPNEHASLTAKASARYLGEIEAAAQAAGVRCECVSVEGDFPAEAILRVAAKRKCDLIVMASHGRRGIAGALLGSETQKVLVQAKVPVLVCR